jgi:hypothetical protein
MNSILAEFGYYLQLGEAGLTASSTVLSEYEAHFNANDGRQECLPHGGNRRSATADDWGFSLPRLEKSGLLSVAALRRGKTVWCAE